MDFKYNDTINNKLYISDKYFSLKNKKDNNEIQDDVMLSEFNLFKPSLPGEKYQVKNNITVLESMLSDFIDAFKSIKNNPEQLKNPRALVTLTLMGMPLLSMLLLRITGSSNKTSVFMLGFSQAFQVYINVYRMYNIGANFKISQSVSRNSTFATLDAFRKSFYVDSVSDTILKIVTLGKFYLPVIVFGVGLGIVIMKIFQAKFSKHQLLSANNNFKFAGVYLSGVLSGIIVGLISFVYQVKRKKGSVNIKDAIKSYIKFTTKGLVSIVKSYEIESTMSMEFLFSLIISILQLIIYAPTFSVLISDYLKHKDAIEYVGTENNNKKLKNISSKLSKKIEKTTKKTLKETSNLIIKKTKKDFKVDGFLNIISSMITANKFVKSKRDLYLLYSALKGKEKFDLSLNLRSVSSLKNDMKKLNKKLSESYIEKFKLDDEFVLIEGSSEKPAHMSTNVGIFYARNNPDVIFNINSEIKNVEDIHKLDPLPIGSTYESFKRATIKAIVDLYYSLKEHGYKVNDLDIAIYKTPVPPFSIGSSVHIGYLKKLFAPDLTSNHIAAVLAHECGHVFNQDTMSSMVSIIPVLLGLLSAVFAINFKGSGLTPIERIMFMSSFAISFNAINQVGKMNEIRADAFSIKLGYDVYLYEALSKFLVEKSYIEKLLTEFTDVHGDLEKRLKALKEIIEIADKSKYVKL